MSSSVENSRPRYVHARATLAVALLLTGAAACGATNPADASTSSGVVASELMPGKGPAPVSLGEAGEFAILAKSAISTVPFSSVTGDIGISPAAATYITGFSLVADPSNVFATSPQILGKVFAAPYAVPTPADLTAAVGAKPVTALPLQLPA